MSWIHGFAHRLRVRLRPDAYAAEMAEEQRFHEEMARDDRRARAGGGDPRGDGPELRSSIFDRVAQDLAYAIRGLRRAPGFTVVVATTLALGVGANAAVFSMLDRLFNQPPAGVRNPEGLRRLYIENPRALMEDGRRQPRAFPLWSYWGYTAVEGTANGAYDLAAWIPAADARLGDADAELPVRLSFVSHDYFDVLSVGARQGRLFGPDESRVDVQSPVAVISQDLWDRAFGLDPSIVGRNVTLDGTPVTIVGVAGERFVGLDLGYTDVFLPLSMFTGGRPQLGIVWYDETGTYLHAVARLAPGVSDAQIARQATAGYHRRTLAGYGGDAIDSTHVVLPGPILETRGPGRLAGNTDRIQAMSISTRMMGVSSILLLIACANMAGMLLLRAAQRRREIAVRIALGISRGRLAFQLVTEGLLLALLGGIAGAVAAGFGGRALRRLLLPEIRWSEPLTEPRTWAFALAVTAAAGLVVGLAPIIQMARSTSWLDLKAGAPADAPRSLLRSGLIAAQVAMSVVLVVGAGLFVKSLGNANAIRLGFDVTELAFVHNLTPVPGAGDPRTAVTDLVATLEAAPGVSGVAMAASPPTMGFGFVRFFLRDGETGEGRPPEVDAAMNTVSSSYFDVTGTRILEGRGFTEGETAGVVVDETMARTYWSGRSALGQCLVGGRPDGPCRYVIGVAETQQFRVVQEGSGPWYFLPLQATSTPRSVLLRVDPRRWSEVADIARGAVAGRFNERLVRIGTMAEVLEPQYRPWRVGARLFGVFGALALLVTAVGIYGVMSYSVTQRTHEMGVRLALGAEMRDLLRLIVNDGLRIVCAGAAVGVVAALALGRLVESFLFGVTARDPVTSLAAVAVLMTAGIAASLLPALRAGRVDPCEALRQD
jgi:putative ABC transport system permease protein